MFFKELRSRRFWGAMLAELLGTLVLVSAVLGASVPGPGEASVGPLQPAVAVGVAIVALCHCFGEISGTQVKALIKVFYLWLVFSLIDFNLMEKVPKPQGKNN